MHVYTTVQYLYIRSRTGLVTELTIDGMPIVIFCALAA